MRGEIESSNARWEFCEACQSMQPITHRHGNGIDPRDAYNVDVELATSRKYVGIKVIPEPEHDFQKQRRRSHWYRI